MKHSLTRRLLCAILTLVLMIPGAAWAQQEAGSAESGTIEVLLKSLGEVYALNITLSGSYSLNANTGFRLNEDASLRATAVGGEVWLACGGINLNMGESVTLTRHQKEGDNGL